MNRRLFLRLMSGLGVGGLAAATYGFIIEPGFRLNITRYAFTPPNWTPGLKLRIAVLADPHLTIPQMSPQRWQRIIATANALEPDLHLLLGDYLATHPFSLRQVQMQEAAQSARALVARLGTYAVLGNHDWWVDRRVQKTGAGPPEALHVFEDAGIPVLENRALRIANSGSPFWLTGTASMVAIRKGHRIFESRALLPETLSLVNDSAPVIHLAHEPDLFVQIPERVSLTLSGHTHGGQVRLFGYSPVVPSEYGNRFAYGHVIEGGRHLIVSGGLGCSTLPLRLGSPPEIVLLELG